VSGSGSGNARPINRAVIDDDDRIPAADRRQAATQHADSVPDRDNDRYLESSTRGIAGRNWVRYAGVGEPPGQYGGGGRVDRSCPQLFQCTLTSLRQPQDSRRGPAEQRTVVKFLRRDV
jgi:hypothetical protein